MSMPGPGRVLRAAVAAGVAAGLLLAAAGPASAHVEVSAAPARQGASATLTFAVVSEIPDVTTTAVQLLLPPGQGLRDVTLLPAAGWTAAAAPAGSPAPTQITWTSDDPSSALKLGNYGVFMLTATLPRVPRLSFRVVQTYSDGEVVRWEQPRGPGGAEPAKPAAVLALYTDAEFRAVARAAAEAPDRSGGEPVDGSGQPPAVSNWTVGLVLLGTALLFGLGWRVTRHRGHGRRRHADAPPERVPVAARRRGRD